MLFRSLQIKNHNFLVEAMPSIVLSPDPKMQEKRISIQQELDMESRIIILEAMKPKLKSAKYVRECYGRKRLQLKGNRHSSRNSLIRPMIRCQMKQLNC